MKAFKKIFIVLLIMGVVCGSSWGKISQKDIKITDKQSSGGQLVSGTQNLSFSVPDLAKGVAVTAISGKLWAGAFGTFTVKISKAGNPTVEFNVINKKEPANDPKGFYCILPVPAKYVGGSTLNVAIVPESGGGYQYKDLCVQYIPLPL